MVSASTARDAYRVMSMAKNFFEQDMYEPIKKYFVLNGFNVHAEVKDCDIAAVRDDILVAVEMKKSLTVKLLCQALERQKAYNAVFIAIPRPKNFKAKDFKEQKMLIRALNLGLITVAMDSRVKTVEILLKPKVKAANEIRQNLVKREMMARSKDLNVGGSSKKPILTAYKEESIKIACIFKNRGAMSAARLKNEFGCSKNAYSILRNNFYGWFEKQGKGIYTITIEGIKALTRPEFREIIRIYEGAELGRF